MPYYAYIGIEQAERFFSRCRCCWARLPYSAGYSRDTAQNVPIERLKELATEGVIGEVADYHYLFLGAPLPRGLEPRARQRTRMLKKDHVDAILLTPV